MDMYNYCTIIASDLPPQYRFAFKMDDPAFGRIPRAAALWFRGVPARYQLHVRGWQEESDAATTKVYT